MVRGLALLILFSQAVMAAEPSLRLELAQTRVERGKFLPANLVYVGPEDPGEFKLEPWSTDFYVERRNHAVQAQDGSQIEVSETIRLYPRRQGPVTLAAIASGGAILMPVALQVTAAKRGEVDIDAHWSQVPTGSVWQGAPLLVSVQQGLTDQGNEVVAADWELLGFDIHALPNQRQQREGHGVVQQSWVLIPQQKGQFSLEPPALQQRGRGRWRFHLPQLSVLVKPLPSYIPPTVAIGKPRLHSEIEAHGHKDHYTLTISSNGPLTTDLYGIRKALAKATGSEIEAVEVLAPGVSKERSTTGISNSLRYRVPVPTWSIGIGPGAQISIPYFDTEKGVLAHLSHRLPPAWNLPAWFKWLLASAALAIALPLLKALRQPIQRLRGRRRLRQQIQDAPDPHTLRQLLLQANHHQTLSAWALKQGTSEAQVLAEQLNTACFSPHSVQAGAFTELKARASQ